jgi:lysophospholipase L1-like esterase
MNHNRHVIVFTLVTTGILLCCSVYSTITNDKSLSLNRISILSDVFRQPKSSPGKNNTKTTLDIIQKKADTAYRVTGVRSLYEYTRAKTLTSFNTDTSKAALPLLMRKLLALKHGKKQKIRVAWFGDSLIEGDLIAQTFRKDMQQYFGGYGVGFVPAMSVTAAFRTTVSHKWKGDWKEESFRSDTLTAPLFLSGHTFFTSNGALIVRDATVKDTTQRLEKSLICGMVPGTISLIVNGQVQQYKPSKLVNRLLLDSSVSHSIDVGIQNYKLPVYGISMEPQSGVVVDNFSFRGISGRELGKLDTAFLRAVDEENPYDLVILQYGANIMWHGEDTEYGWYEKMIVPVLKKLRQAMPGAEFLVVSTADRAFKYDDLWKTALGIDNLIRIQADLAYNSDAAFYNMYESMGGAGTIVSWADTVPSLANKDYIHPNQRGAEILGNMFYNAFMSDLRKIDSGKFQ